MPVPTYNGVEGFVTAVMGGGVNESAAYDARMQRLINQRSSAALMDKRIQDAITSKQEADAMIALNDVIEDPLVRALTQSGTGSSYSGAQTGEGKRMQNEMLAAIAPLLNAGAAQGEIPVDALNALIAGGTGKLLSPSNVNVVPQALADTRAQESMADYRDALTGKTAAQTVTEGSRRELVDQQIQTEEARGVTQQNLGHKYVSDRGYTDARTGLVEAQTGYWDDRYRGGPSSSSSGKAPFNSASYINALLGTPNEDGMYTVDPEFFKWQWEQAQIDPEYNDDRFAYGAWQNGVNATPPDGDPLAAVTGSEEPAAVDGPQVTSQEDAQMLIQVAEEMIRANPEQADLINANLQAALAKAGFNVPNQRTGSGSP